MQQLKYITFFLLTITIIVDSAFANQSTINIQSKYRDLPYQCHAVVCYYPSSEKAGMIKNAEFSIRNMCSPSSLKALGNTPCDRERENKAQIEQCLNIECLNVRCKNLDLLTQKCLGAYFP